MTSTQFRIFCYLFKYFTQAICAAIMSIRPELPDRMAREYEADSNSATQEMSNFLGASDYE